MAGNDDDLRQLLEQAAAEEAFLDRDDAELNAKSRTPTTSPTVSLMITNRQRAALRELGFSEESIRQMTPYEAHGKLGLG